MFPKIWIYLLAVYHEVERRRARRKRDVRARARNNITIYFFYVII